MKTLKLLHISIAIAPKLWYVFVLTGGDDMYDYMQALRSKFHTANGSEVLRREYKKSYDDLQDRLSREDSKLLRRLTDLQNLIQDEASLQSFVSGYKLACGR